MLWSVILSLTCVGEIKYGLIENREKTPSVVVCHPKLLHTYVGNGWVGEIKKWTDSPVGLGASI